MPEPKTKTQFQIEQDAKVDRIAQIYINACEDQGELMPLVPWKKIAEGVYLQSGIGEA